ncbi:hypothetical protein LTR85_001307 [Meristemomyces frigidus]|nr:hypothetical protein LTR85_001307 [Meristemomyces frigidus]
MCTRFATEIVLRHAEEPTRIQAEIVPYRSRSEASIIVLKEFLRKLETFEELPMVITEVATLIGVRNSGSNTGGPAFASDILQISVSGRTGLHLSVVDLPGLISVPSEKQTEDDLETVHALVDTYVGNTRTIILAVVQANNGIANQGIIQKSRKHDPLGQRTVRIITKPDLINKGTEARIARLARNQGTTKLELGQREESERAYFAASPWRELFLDDDKVGIANLRHFLQQLLDRHMAKELPNVKEIKKLVESVEKQLDDLGEGRPTARHLRTYLSRLAMRFHILASAALHGNYDITDIDFFSRTKGPEDHIRARAFLHFANTRFANDMREYGHTLKVGDSQRANVDSDSDASDVLNPRQTEVSEIEMKELIVAVNLSLPHI